MKITKAQLKEVIKEELNEIYDPRDPDWPRNLPPKESPIASTGGRVTRDEYGSRQYFQSLAPAVQGALDREFGADAFIAALEEAQKNAAFGGSRMFSPQRSASEVFARLMVKRVFGGNSRWTEPAQ